MASRPPTGPCVPVWYTAPPLFMPLQTCGSKNRRTGIQPSQAFGLRGLFAVWGWMLSASTPFWNWQGCPHFYGRFPVTQDTLALGYTLPAVGRIRDFHPLPLGAPKTPQGSCPALRTYIYDLLAENGD